MFDIKIFSNTFVLYTLVSILLYLLSFVTCFTNGTDIGMLCTNKQPIDASLTHFSATLIAKSNYVWTFDEKIDQISGPNATQYMFDKANLVSIDAGFHIFPDKASNDEQTRRMSALAFVFKDDSYFVLHFNMKTKGYSLYSHAHGVPFGLKPGKGPISLFNFGTAVRKVDAALFNKKTHEALIFVQSDVYILNMKKWTDSPAAPVKKTIQDVIKVNYKIEAAFELGEEEFVIVVNYHYCLMSWSHLNCKLEKLSNYLPCNGLKPSGASSSSEDSGSTLSGSIVSTSESSMDDIQAGSSTRAPIAAIIIMIFLILFTLIIVTIAIPILFIRKGSNDEQNQDSKGNRETSKSNTSRPGFDSQSSVSANKPLKKYSTLSGAYAAVD